MHMDVELIVWISLAVVFAVFEAITVQLTTLWFAVGSIGAIFAKLFGAPEWLQVTVFVLLSTLCLVVLRPYLRKYTKTAVQPTNADMLIGVDAVVKEDIDNTYDTGAASVRGLVWTARSSDGEHIEKGAVVVVEKIEGAKLIVRRK